MQVKVFQIYVLLCCCLEFAYCKINKLNTKSDMFDRTRRTS